MAEKTATKKATPKKVAARKAAPKTAAAKKATTKATAPKAAPQSDAFAVIATGGKQYVVRPGDTLEVEKLPREHKAGDTITFSDVLLVDDGKTTKVGTPTVSGAKVTASFIEDGRAKKISVIRFRSKSRYFKNKGHRQPYSKVTVEKIG